MAEHQNECGVSMCARCQLLTNLYQLTVVESELGHLVNYLCRI